MSEWTNEWTMLLTYEQTILLTNPTVSTQPTNPNPPRQLLIHDYYQSPFITINHLITINHPWQRLLYHPWQWSLSYHMITIVHPWQRLSYHPWQRSLSYHMITIVHPWQRLLSYHMITIVHPWQRLSSYHPAGVCAPPMPMPRRKVLVDFSSPNIAKVQRQR